jgi:hypothetical protein
MNSSKQRQSVQKRNRDEWTVFGKRINTSDIVERTDKDTNSPVVNSDPFADKVPVDAALIHETLMGETITHEAPAGTDAGSSGIRLHREESEHFRTLWNEIQGKFMDEPRCRP